MCLPPLNSCLLQVLSISSGLSPISSFHILVATCILERLCSACLCSSFLFTQREASLVPEPSVPFAVRTSYEEYNQTEALPTYGESSGCAPAVMVEDGGADRRANDLAKEDLRKWVRA